MSPVRRGLLLAAVHASLILALSGKLLVDRARYPRVWARTVPVDPDLPIRGRYAALRLVVKGPAAPAHGRVSLTVSDGELTARPAKDSWTRVQPLGSMLVLDRPVAFFLPEHAPDPTRLAPGTELWAEVTVPPKGMPRPLRLAVK